jgi:hypothetical protein
MVRSQLTFQRQLRHPLDKLFATSTVRGQLRALIILQQVLQHHRDVPADHITERPRHKLLVLSSRVDREPHNHTPQRHILPQEILLDADPTPLPRTHRSKNKHKKKPERMKFSTRSTQLRSKSVSSSGHLHLRVSIVICGAG